jgi:hypothetical protein
MAGNSNPFLSLKLFQKNYIWKQFLNNLTLNHEYPLKISFPFELEKEVAFDNIKIDLKSEALLSSH